MPGDAIEHTHLLVPDSERSTSRYTDDTDDTDVPRSEGTDETHVTGFYPVEPPKSFRIEPNSGVSSRSLSENNITSFPQLALDCTQPSNVSRMRRWIVKVALIFWGFLNPPLWAMIIALMVACIPGLQPFFFTKGTFVYNSVTTATTTAGDCAVPLILVVLGANLAAKKDESEEELPYSNKMVWTAIVSRMLLVPLLLLPIIASLARYAPISVVDDRKFWLPQICLSV